MSDNLKGDKRAESVNLEGDEARDKFAEAYMIEDFTRNPSGYTVAPWVNAYTTYDACVAAWDAAVEYMQGKK